jgi:hypothetical protein
LVDDFVRFLKDSTKLMSISDSLYMIKAEEYCAGLKKIETLFSTQRNEVDLVITRKYETQLIKLRQQIEDLNNKREKNLSTIQTLQ